MMVSISLEDQIQQLSNTIYMLQFVSLDAVEYITEKKGITTMDEVHISVAPGGRMTVAAYCLKTDSWNDYLSFKEEAKEAMSLRNTRKANRNLRAALVCFFAHLEGVVNDIYDYNEIPSIFTGNRLCDRTRNIGAEAKKRVYVPFVAFRLEKHLRDLIVHSGIEIAFQDASNDVMLNQASVFERLDLRALEELANTVSPWINAVCSAFNIDRFTDTKQIVTNVSESIAERTVSNIREV